MKNSDDPKDPDQEALRRAEIIKRYISRKPRTAEDDENFAQELGVAVETLHQLVRTWRRYQDPRFLSGARIQITDADRKAAIAAAGEPDLTGVDPARRPLVRKRLAILRQYLSLKSPNKNDEAAAAKKLGLSLSSFRRLYRNWVMARDPATFPGGSTPRTIRERRSPAISADAEACVTAVISDMGPTATTLAVYEEVIFRCRRDGLKAPSQGAVYARTIRARNAVPIDRDRRSIAVDHVALDLAVENEGNPSLPVLSVLIEFPSGRIVRHAVSYEAPSPQGVAKLLASFLNAPSEFRRETVPLEIGIPKGREWSLLFRILDSQTEFENHDIRRSLRSGRDLMRLFGQHFERIRMRPRATTNPAEANIRKLGGGSVPLSAGEANQVVQGIINRHNESRTSHYMTFTPAHVERELLEQLSRINS